MDLSIVIRTWNSEKTLAGVLERLHLVGGDEIVIVDSGSTDRTLDIGRQYGARIVEVRQPFNYSRSLNIGFAAAKNPWVLSLSSHCLPLPPDLLKIFRQAAQSFPANVVVAYGVVSLVDLKATPPGKIIFASLASSLDERRAVYSGNSLALYRRDAWQKQPFDESLQTAEDMAWFLQALASGAQAARVPSAVVLYRNPATLARMFQKGWTEARMEVALMGLKQQSLRGWGIMMASLAKKCVTRKIPVSVFLRHSAHALGAYLSPKFDSRRSTGLSK